MAQETSRRVQRVEKEIRDILGTYLIREFQNRIAGLVTVSHVRISPDLKHGRVYLHVLGQTEAQAKIQERELFDEIKERHGEIQRYLGKNLGTKFCPKLEFFHDDTLDEVLKVERTLKMIASERARQEDHPEIHPENQTPAIPAVGHPGATSLSAEVSSSPIPSVDVDDES